MAQTLTEIKALLDARGMHPRKRFGQNFLVDQQKVRRIVEATGVSAGDRVLEVGPGTGALTEALLDAGATVTAVEIDRDLCAILRDRLGTHERFTLIEGDALASKHALSADVIEALHQPPPPPGEGRGGGGATGEGPPDHPADTATGSTRPQSPPSGGRPMPFRLIANLPYNIASPLLATLVLDYPAMTGAVVMVQREVADRMLARPGGKTFGPLTVTLQLMCTVELVTHLPPACFWPRPKVDSSVVRLTRRAKPQAAEPKRVTELAARLFQQRRKQIGSVLGRATDWPDGIDPTMRAEQLSVEQFVALTNAV